MGYLELIRWCAELPARIIWSLVTDRPEDFDYPERSTTTRPLDEEAGSPGIEPGPLG